MDPASQFQKQFRKESLQKLEEFMKDFHEENWWSIRNNNRNKFLEQYLKKSS